MPFAVDLETNTLVFTSSPYPKIDNSGWREVTERNHVLQPEDRLMRADQYTKQCIAANTASATNPDCTWPFALYAGNGVGDKTWGELYDRMIKKEPFLAVYTRVPADPSKVIADRMNKHHSSPCPLP